MAADFYGGDRAVAHLDELAARTQAPTSRFQIVWGQVRNWAAELPSLNGGSRLAGGSA